MRKTHFKVLLLATAMISCAGQAFADLIGSSVDSQYYAYGSTYDSFGSPVSFVANGSVQETFCASCPQGFTLTVANNQITYTLLDDSAWSPSTVSYNVDGVVISNGNLLTFTGATITSVTVDGATNLAGFGAGNVTFNASNIGIDWVGLGNGAAGEVVVLDVNTSSSITPEPATWTGMVLGFALLGFELWRRQNLTA